MIKKLSRYILLSLCALSCVGHPADDLDDEDISGPSGPTEEGAPALLLDFTATWCVNCPRMASAIEEASRQRPGSVFPVSVHFRDALSFADGEALAADFGVQAYPSLVTNLSASSLITATSSELILSKIDATAAQRKGTCSLTLTAESTAAGQYKLVAEAGVTDAGSYRLGALLVEDGIVAPQTGGSDDYVHNDVLRKILSGSIAGEDLGSLSSGASVRKEFSFETNGTGSFRVVAYVTDGELVQTVAAVTLP